VTDRKIISDVTNTQTHTYRTTRVSRHQKGKPFWISLKQEMMGGSGISWTIYKCIFDSNHLLGTSGLSL